ncbi:plexin domain-containing protein 2-like [Amphiura filiformis]|uniref:plexin domain-containing protein 2-like n=1 Tax=Amphiura filiformis TaxID=82378 RepID=UPI003B212E50
MNGVHVPISADTISGGNGHKVTVGLSDGFYIDEPIAKGSTTIKRTIYRYHTVDLNRTKVVSNSAFLLTPLLTCNQFQNCNTCLSQAPVIKFDCRWCNAIKRCSSGFDRYRQDWLENDCLTESIEPHQTCPGPSSDAVKKKANVPSSTAGAIIAVIVVIIVLALWAGIAWLIYAYRNPTSNSGLFLIELRHYFKKDSTTATSNEDRYAVTISGDMHQVGTNGDAIEVAPEKPAAPPPDTSEA